MTAPMRRGGPALLVLAAVVFVGGSLTGFNLLTSQATTTTAAPTCDRKVVQEGEPVTANLVTVNVYNASRTAGLANRVSVLLQRRGFLTGTVANNPTDIATNNVVVLGADENDPRVRLVRAQFGGKVATAAAPPGLEGVSVLVGSNYADRGLTKRGEGLEVTSDRTLTACVPILPVS